MIEDVPVVDAVVHGYNSPPETWKHPLAGVVVDSLYNRYHRIFSPRDDPKWILDRHRFERVGPELLEHALFAESRTDFAVYHDIPLYGMYEQGASPLWIGREMRERNPDRVAVFGGIWPGHPDPVGEVDRLVDEEKVVGLKFYPYDIYDGRGETVRMDDVDSVFPILEHAQRRGIRSVAVHKAIAMVGCPVQPFAPGDLDNAFLAFPELNFQIVHGGFAFLEDTALQLSYYPNASVVLEGASAYLVNSPLRFAEILSAFVRAGAADRIIWGTGCTALHPQPLLDAFWEFQFPDWMIEGYGLPPLTKELKRKILGGNIARILDLKVTPDPAERELAEPWTGGAAVPA
ncbi:amidohydrolase family protein [Streptomyces sp. NPDC054784]